MLDLRFDFPLSKGHPIYKNGIGFWLEGYAKNLIPYSTDHYRGYKTAHATSVTNTAVYLKPIFTSLISHSKKVSMTQIIQALFALTKLILYALIGFIFFLATGGRMANKSKYKGAFMSWFDRVRLINKRNQGVAVDGKNLKLSKENSTLHCAVIGATGSFKSTIQYANLMNLVGSKLIIDVDGKALATTGGDQLKQGKKIQKLHFSLPGISSQANFLDYVLNDSDSKWLAQKIVGATYKSGSKSDNAFWEHSASSLISLLISITKRMDTKYHTIANVRHLCQNFFHIEPIVTDYASPELFSQYVAIMSMDRKTLAGVQASALVCLDRLSGDVMEHLSAQSTFSFEEFIQGNTTLYIVIPESMIETYSVFVTIFLELLFKYIISNKPKEVIYFILDEFAQFPFSSFPTLSTVLRRYNCSLTILLQSYSQLVSRFGDADARTILYGSCATRLIMPGADLRLAQEISQSLGKMGMRITDKKGGYTATREVLSPREIIQLKKGQCLFLFRNMSPYIIKKTYPYFKQRSLLKRSKAKIRYKAPKPLEKPSLFPIPLDKKLSL